MSGAHAIEVDHAARWLAPDWVMLTTGVQLRGHSDAQRSLIAELEAAHVSALGFGVGVVFKRTPPALRAEAEARGYPIFEIPLRTPFREVISAVNRSLVGGEMRIYQRLSSMQRYLVDALTHEDPQGTLLSRLGDLLDATVLVYAADGSVELATGPAPTASIWCELVTRSDAFIAEFEVSDGEEWHTVATPVIRPGGAAAARWLVVSSARAGFSSRLAKPAAQATAPLLAAISRLDDLALEQERAVRSSVLEELLGAREGRELRGLAARAAALGLDFEHPARIVVVTARAGGANGQPSVLKPARQQLHQRLGDAGVSHLDCLRGSELVALVQHDAAALRRVASALATEDLGVAVGIGRPIPDVAGVRDSYRDAQLAAAHAARAHDGVVDFADFDVATLLITEVAEARVRSKVEECLAPLHAKPGLYDTLVAYFEHDLDIVATAQALHLHANTLRYRLSRVEQLLGRSLKQPATIATLHIALTTDPPPAHR